ncbi:MAG: hypothetical protein AAB663_01725 [Patescibacteria group bacterium]
MKSSPKKHHAQSAMHADIVKEVADESKAMDEGLAAIYGEERDDLGTVDRAASGATRWLVRVVIGLAVVAVVSYLGYFVYAKLFSGATVNPLTIAVETDAAPVSGTVATVTVRYANTGRGPLAKLSIDCNLPDAFHMTTMTPEPTNADELVWNLGSLGANEDGAITFTGTWIADVPSTTTVQALATYRPANFNADFDAVASQSVSTTASTLTVTDEGPDNVTAGAAAAYTFTLENTGEIALPGTGFALTLPTGFYVTTSTPPLTAGAAPTWAIGDLAPHVPTVITVTGAFTADVEDVQQIDAAVTVAFDGITTTQAKTQVFTDVQGNGLRLQLVANGSTGDVAIDPGSPLRISVGYENTGESSITDLSLLLDFQAVGKAPITWSDATLDGGTTTADGIKWSTTTLGAVAAGEKKTRNAIFPLKDTLAAGDAQTFSVVVHATVDGVTTQSQPLTITLNSDTSFTAASRYFTDDGAPVGDGPLPPTVGDTTSYQLEWTVHNALHALKDVRVSATLPPSANWTDTTSTAFGAVSYDAATRTVTWVIADMPADTGDVTATLRVSVTPNGSDVGSFVKLLSGSAFRATDTVTNASIQLNADSLTTECEGDENVAGKGTVE